MSGTDHVLIVDDDPVQRRLIAAAVSGTEHEPVVAEGGEEALRALEGPRVRRRRLTR